METITQFRLPDGEVIRLVDWVDKPLFSTLQLLTGWSDRKIDCFTYGVGQSVPATSNATVRRTSTENDTNVDTGGAAVSTEELLIYAIKPEFFELQCSAEAPTDMNSASPRLGGQPMPRTNILALLNALTKIKLTISQKAYADAGLGWYNTGFGPMTHGFVVPNAAAAATVRSYATSGLPSQEAVRTFAVPHHIGGTEKYQVSLVNAQSVTVTFNDEQTTPAALARLVYNVRIYLDGMRKRPTA